MITNNQILVKTTIPTQLLNGELQEAFIDLHNNKKVSEKNIELALAVIKDAESYQTFVNEFWSDKQAHTLFNALCEYREYLYEKNNTICLSSFIVIAKQYGIVKACKDVFMVGLTKEEAETFELLYESNCNVTAETVYNKLTTNINLNPLKIVL